MGREIFGNGCQLGRYHIALMRQPGNDDAISRLPQEPRGARCTEQGEGKGSGKKQGFI